MIMKINVVFIDKMEKKMLEILHELETRVLERPMPMINI